jgi:HSP20 family molecular chaperone IbpA
MSQVASKSLLLSQPKAGQNESVPVPSLTYSTNIGESSTEYKVEIPGVDPSGVNVEFEGSNIAVHCERGQLILSVHPSTDTTSIKAEILWGVLTLTVPLPKPPEAHSIKVNIHDAVKKAPAKPSTKSVKDDEN